MTEYTEEDKSFGEKSHGVLISGLYMEGAKFDVKKKTLIESIPGQIYYKMPLIQFIPKETAQQKGQFYRAPLYKTLNRSGNLLTTG